MRYLTAFLLFTLSTTFAFGETATANEQAELDNALSAAQSVMKDPKARQEAIRTSPDAAQADRAVQSLGDAATTEAIYSLAADILGTMGKADGRDPNKVAGDLERAQANPEAFANSLTPEQKQKLHEIADKIEKSKTPVP